MLVSVIFFAGLLLNQANFLDSSSKIYGGEEVKPHRYPFQARVTSFRPERNISCGGSLLTKKWVITAAHCLWKSSKVKVILGAHNLSDHKERGRQIFLKNKWVVHRNYNRSSLDNDVALVRLARAATFNRYVTTIRLPRGDNDYAGYLGKILGWGRTDTGEPSLVLRKVEVAILTNNACRNMGYNHKIKEFHICAYFDYLKGSCKGDSGGPLLIRETRLKHVLVGVVSFGKRNCSEKRVSVLTRVSTFSKWIEINISEKRKEHTAISSIVIITANISILMYIK